MRQYQKILLLVICLACGKEQTSTLKDYPLEKLSDNIQKYAKMSHQELDKLFLLGKTPDSIPLGRAIGYHKIDASSTAQPPDVQVWAVRSIWHAKRFVYDKKSLIHMVDDTVIPNFAEPLKAKVSIEPLKNVFKRNFPEQLILGMGTKIDDKPSLITDYSSWEYSIVMKPLMKPFQYWVDEYRVISKDQPQLLIGRSYYKGVFWSHLIIEFE